MCTFYSVYLLLVSFRIRVFWQFEFQKHCLFCFVGLLVWGLRKNLHYYLLDLTSSITCGTYEWPEIAALYTDFDEFFEKNSGDCCCFWGCNLLIFRQKYFKKNFSTYILNTLKTKKKVESASSAKVACSPFKARKRSERGIERCSP